MGYTKVVMQKKEFVHKELTALLCKVDPAVTGVEYEYDENGEYVKVFYEKACIRINVTGDSLGAIAQDVLMKIL